MSSSKKDLPFQSANLRPVVSRFGGMISESPAVDIPVQPRSAASPPGSATDFNQRHAAALSNVYAGIPGYQGYKPHGSHHNVLGESAAPKPHSQLQQNVDTSHQPYVMPVVGYGGHVRRSQETFGASHWKNSGNITGHKPAASQGWDNRDVAGRPFGGQTPGDFGQYAVDPVEYEQQKREADEANEILELRSMGIRALLKKQDLTGPPGR